MTNNVQLLKDAAIVLVEAVLSTVDSFAGALIDKGRWMVQMLADGVSGAVDILTDAAVAVVNAMMAAMEAAVAAATPPTPPSGPTAPTSPNGPTSAAGGGPDRTVTVNVYNPTGAPTETSVMRSMKTLAAIGVLNPV